MSAVSSRKRERAIGTIVESQKKKKGESREKERQRGVSENTEEPPQIRNR